MACGGMSLAGIWLVHVSLTRSGTLDARPRQDVALLAPGRDYNIKEPCEELVLPSRTDVLAARTVRAEPEGSNLRKANILGF